MIGGKPAAEVVRQSNRIGYAGDDLAGASDSRERSRACRRSSHVADLPGAPDAVFLAVNRHATIDCVRELAATRRRAARCCYAAGFAEAGGEGEALQSALRAAAGDMPVLGPNCYGLINYVDGALLWPDQHGGERVERGVAHRHAVGQHRLQHDDAAPRTCRSPISCTMGNQASRGPFGRCVETLAYDERVTAIGLHIEGIDDPDAFRARRRGGARAEASRWSR